MLFFHESSLRKLKPLLIWSPLSLLLLIPVWKFFLNAMSLVFNFYCNICFVNFFCLEFLLFFFKFQSEWARRLLQRPSPLVSTKATKLPRSLVVSGPPTNVAWVLLKITNHFDALPHKISCSRSMASMTITPALQGADWTPLICRKKFHIYPRGKHLFSCISFLCFQ